MPQELNYLKQTASQTAGPYVHIGLAPGRAGFDIFDHNFGHIMVTPQTVGERIIIEGLVLDGTGTPMRDALVELWQANAAGKYNHPADTQNKPIDPHFRGWGRSPCDFETGFYRFETIKPGQVMGRNGKSMAPHVSLWIVARGINIGLQTRAYFYDEEVANAADPILNLVEQDKRRKTLIASRSERDGQAVYRFDIVFQGENETVFFDV